MILLFVGAGGFLFFLLLSLAGWKLACIGTRQLLDIPDSPTLPAAEVQQLPYYLDDRLPRPE
jgi:hypothetical protein